MKKYQVFVSEPLTENDGCFQFTVNEKLTSFLYERVKFVSAVSIGGITVFSDRVAQAILDDLYSGVEYDCVLPDGIYSMWFKYLTPQEKELLSDYYGLNIYENITEDVLDILYHAELKKFPWKRRLCEGRYSLKSFNVDEKYDF